MNEEMNGLSDLGYDIEAYAPIEDLAEDYEFFGLGQMLTKEMLQSHLIAAAAGGGGILAVMNVLDRVEYFADKPKGRALAEILIGIAGGRLLWNTNRDAAMGFAGGVAGYGLASIVNQYIAEMDTGASNGNGTESLHYTEVHDVPGYRKLNRVSVPRGWGGGRAPRGMNGLGRDIVTRANYDQIHGLEDVDEAVGSWVS